MKLKPAFWALALLACLAGGACQRVEPLPSAEELAAAQDERIRAYLTSLGLEASDTARVKKTAGGTYAVLDTLNPAGSPLRNGMTVMMRYRGRVLDSTRTFDENYSEAEPYRFDLGVGDVVKGWEEGLLKFRVGEAGRLIIPSVSGYGAQARESIPANSILYFDVKVVNAQ